MTSERDGSRLDCFQLVHKLVFHFNRDKTSEDMEDYNMMVFYLDQLMVMNTYDGFYQIAMFLKTHKHEMNDVYYSTVETGLLVKSLRVNPIWTTDIVRYLHQ